MKRPVNRDRHRSPQRGRAEPGRAELRASKASAIRARHAARSRPAAEHHQVAAALDLELAPQSATRGELRVPRSIALRFRDSLLLPVLLAAAVIVFTDRFPARLAFWGLGTSLTGTGKNHHSGTSRPRTTIAEAGEELVGPPDEPVSPVQAIAPADALVPTVARLDAATDRPGERLAAAEGGDPALLPRNRACTLADAVSAASAAKLADLSVSVAFGVALAAAAEAQVSDFVVYNDDYRNMRYPGGDVAALYGVCTDVVIRAYRAMGIDLQKIVHEARVGAGDTAIDHRRTQTLRRYFANYGVNLPVTDFADAFLPGDVVTYDRPQNRHGQAHIAIVSNTTGPSGRLMIVHNRGYGPQLEDALFVDEMAGHFRFDGHPRTVLSEREQSSRPPAHRNSSTILIRRAAAIRAIGRGGAGQKTAPKL